MSYVDVTRKDEVTIVTLHRGKVNPIDEAVARELLTCLNDLSREDDTRAIVLTGHGKFFSFGLDVPGLYPLAREDFTRFVTLFTELYTTLYALPKPVVAAVNGHAIAGGCMLATACDVRLMGENAGKISLNEITFGASVFAGSVEMLRACVGHRNAETILLTGTMFSPQEALELGLVDRIVPAHELMQAAIEEARIFGSRDAHVFASMKKMLRKPMVEEMRRLEADSIREFVDIWYSESTREQLKKIEIRK